MGQGLLVEHGPITRIIFNRPEQRNAIRFEDWDRLAAVVAAAAANDAVQVIMFTGAGPKAFSAGGDISQFPDRRFNVEQGQIYQAAVERALAAILTSPKPTVARINGVCTGGGLLVASCCDVRLAAVGCRFGMPIARIGVVAGWLELHRLVELIGTGAAADLLLTGRLITAEEARQIGLVNRVTPDDQLDDIIDETVAGLRAGSPLAHRLHKQMLALLPQYPGLENLPARVEQIPIAPLASGDYHEGVTAFLAGRRPRFSGR